MYINPYERMKNLKLNTDEDENKATKEFDYRNLVRGRKNKPEAFNEGLDLENHNLQQSFHNNDQPVATQKIKDAISLNSYEIIRDIVKIFKEKDSLVQFFLTLNTKGDNDVITELSNSFFSVPLVNLDMAKIDLYGSPFLFLLKKIVKGLPQVGLEDKKVLWDRVKLFARTLKSNEKNNNTSDSNTAVIINELEFDDPIEYIRKEFSEIIRAYEIKENIIILFNNVDLVGYEKFRELFILIHTIFKGLTAFKVITGFNPILVESYIKKNYDESLVNELINHELQIFDRKYNLLTNDNSEQDYGQQPETITAPIDNNEESLDQEEDTIGFDYWALRGGR
ncbi:hypothetical protein [Spiroplasma sp. DGKH1]|uniref:hypothetical protein n=1 Tax=Spiroplasma sp. DGKH1 TaxID=3050074 RepID=UPI0034C66362